MCNVFVLTCIVFIQTSGVSNLVTPYVAQGEHLHHLLPLHSDVYQVCCIPDAVFNVHF